MSVTEQNPCRKNLHTEPMFAVTSNGFYIEPKGVGDKGVSQIFKTSWDRLRAMSDGSSFRGATAQGLSYGSQPLALRRAPHRLEALDLQDLPCFANCLVPPLRLFGRAFFFDLARQVGQYCQFQLPLEVMRPEVEKMPDGGSCYTYVSHPVMTLVDAAGVGPEVIESTMSEPCSTADKYQREIKDVFEFVPRFISDDDLT